MKKIFLLISIVFTSVIFAGDQNKLELTLACAYDILMPNLIKNYSKLNVVEKQKTIHAILNLQNLNKEFYKFISNDEKIKQKYLEYGFKHNSKLNNVIKLVCNEEYYWTARNTVNEKNFGGSYSKLLIDFFPCFGSTFVYTTTSLKMLQEDGSYKSLLFSLGQIPFMYGAYKINKFLLKEQNIVENIKNYQNNNKKIKEAKQKLSIHLSSSFFNSIVHDLIYLNLFHEKSKIYENFINNTENNLSINFPSGDCLELSKCASNVENLFLSHSVLVNLIKIENQTSAYNCLHDYKYVLDMRVPKYDWNETVDFNNSKINFKNLAEDILNVINTDYNNQKILIKLSPIKKVNIIDFDKQGLLLYFLGILFDEKNIGQNITFINDLPKNLDCHLDLHMYDWTAEYVLLLRALKKTNRIKYEKVKGEILNSIFLLWSKNPYKQAILDELNT